MGYIFAYQLSFLSQICPMMRKCELQMDCVIINIFGEEIKTNPSVLFLSVNWQYLSP